MITSNIDLIKAQISTTNNSNISSNSGLFLNNLINNANASTP